MSTADQSIVYVDCDLGSTVDQPTALLSQVVRAGPIITRPQDYYVAVSRAVLPAINCPMFICPLALNQTTSPPLDTQWNVTMTWSTFSATVPIQLVRSRFDCSVPALPLASQPTSDYAFVDSYNQYLAMMNAALDNCFVELQAQAGGTFAGFTNQPSSPVMGYNASTGLFSLSCYPFVAWDQFYPGGNQIKVYFSLNFSNYLAGWTTKTLTTAPRASGQDILLVLANTGSNWLDYQSASPGTWVGPPGYGVNPDQPRVPDAAMLVMQQDVAATWALQTAVSSLQICSNLPVSPEFTSPPKPLAGSGVASGSSSNAFTSILTDFVPDVTASPGAYMSPWVYNATTTVPGARFIELQGNSPISSFQVAAFWIDSWGVQRPLVLTSSQQSASIKLVFVKRSIVNSSDDLTGGRMRGAGGNLIQIR